MNREDLTASVLAAQDGDRDAFSRLAEALRSQLLREARARLPERDRAEDVVQEALADAFRLLGTLREPPAFNAWIRSIVAKHCDRATRRRRAIVEGEEAGEAPIDPEALLVSAEAAQALVTRLEALPSGQRTVVALHYFGEVPLADIASLLGLPLTTVKKRLHDARRRIRENMADVPETRRAPASSDSVILHRAIRRDDREAVRGLLARRPDLLDAPEQWTDSEAYDSGLPLSHERTPLIVAASRGSQAMVELLLALGAQVERLCSCANGESALWAAVARGERNVARVLLEAGADPNARNGAGFAPLDLAELRGNGELRALLLRYGAIPGLQPARGGPPADRAVLSRQVSDPHSASAGLLETGIKAVDLFAPLTATALACFQGAAETGLTALVAELSRSLALSGRAVLWATWENGSWPREELEGLAAETGVPAIEVLACRNPLARALARAAALGVEAATLVVFESEGHAVELEAALADLKRLAAPVIVVRPWTAATRGELRAPAGARPWDAWFVTDPAMAARGLFPAIDVSASGSTAPVTAEHAELRAAAVSAIETGGPAAERLRAFLTQPFIVYEHRSGMRGEQVSLAATLDGAGRILGGALDDTDASRLRYLGALAM